MGTKQGLKKKVEIEEQGRTTWLLFSAVALVSSSRLVHLPHRLYLLLREVSDFWEVAPWVASEVAFRRYPPSFPANRKLNVNMGFWREAERDVDYSILLTFGGRPRFLCPAGADEPSAADDDVAFLFLLPLGRPRPRLTGVVGEGSR